MIGNLATTNILIGVIMAMSVIQTGLIVGAGIAFFLLYRRAATLVDQVDRRQVVRAVASVNEILEDVKAISARVRHDLERVEHAVQSTVNAGQTIGSSL